VAGASSAAAPVDSQLAPTDAAALCLATAQQFEQGNRPVEAVAQYERVLSLQPDMPGVSARLAVLHGRLANHELASRHFQKALAQSPRDGRLWNAFGYHHYQNGRWSEAERAFRESCRLDPKLERNQVNLGLALAQQNRLGEAFEAFTKAVSPGAAHSNIGMVLAQQGRSAEALDAFQRALDSEPNLHQTQVARDVVARQGKTGGLILPASHTEMAAPEMPAPAAPGMAGPIAPAVPGMAAPMAPAAPGMAAPGMAAPGMAAPGMAGPGMAAPTAPGPHRFPPTGDFAPAGR
jgi:Tfp pilus assembly protein PilF